MNYLGEVFSLKTADDVEMFFPDEERAFLAYGGFGTPPIDFITKKALDQVGSIEVGYQIKPRPISIRLYSVAPQTRQDYWNYRLLLHELFRPNRGGPMTLTLIRPNQVKRAIVVRPTPGLAFGPRAPESTTWVVDEQLEFIANNPIWFDPDIKTILKTPSGHIASSGTIQYQGTWIEHPTITISGPYTTAVILNETTGAVISMNTELTSIGNHRVITLQPGNLSIVDPTGLNRFFEVDPASDFVHFFLGPDPETPNGQTVIKTTFIGDSSETRMQIDYYSRFFGI